MSTELSGNGIFASLNYLAEVVRLSYIQYLSLGTPMTGSLVMECVNIAGPRHVPDNPDTLASIFSRL